MRFNRFILAALFLVLMASSTQGAAVGEIKPKSGAALQNTYVWDGKELRAKTGASPQATWLFNDREWKQESGASLKNTWVVTGNIPVPVSASVVLGIVR